MRRYLLMMLMVFALALGLSACANDSADPSGGLQRPDGEIYYAKIIAVDGDTITFVNADEMAGSADLLRNSVADAQIIDSEHNALTVADLAPGMLVEIGFGGQIMESYPAQLDVINTVMVMGQGDDLVGFYLDMLNDLWEVDPALNSDISVIAFDLSATGNLSAAEKSALVWLMGEDKGLETVTGTFDELAEAGYIDAENLLFEDGILLSIVTGEINEDSFHFDAEKWASGLGAYFFMDCTAVNEDGEWTYTVGAEAIS